MGKKSEMTVKKGNFLQKFGLEIYFFLSFELQMNF